MIESEFFKFDRKLHTDATIRYRVHSFKEIRCDERFAKFEKKCILMDVNMYVNVNKKYSVNK